jgi:glycine cleavage system protein P-like pyridoxal-binding family
MTKSELRQMIREMLHEELSAHKAELKEASLSSITAYITYINYDGDYSLWNITKSASAAANYFDNEVANANDWPFDPDYAKLFLLEVTVTDTEYKMLKSQNPDDNGKIEQLIKRLEKDTRSTVIDSFE